MTTRTETVQVLTDRLPTAVEKSSAANAANVVAVAMDSACALEVSGQSGEPVELAPAVGELIIELLGHVSAGNMVKLVPVSEMLNTQQAAELLNCSRPYLTKLLKRGAIKFEEVGKQRRVPLSPLMEYKEMNAPKQEAAMRELSRLGQEYDQA